MIDGTLLVFIATGITVLFIGFRFNRNTYSRVKRIQSVAQRQGEQWSFWRNHARMIAFVLAPESLLSSSDTTEMAAAKGELLVHRRTLRRTLFLTFGIMLLGFIVAVALPVAIAFRAAH
jgi:hypothetical protein